MSQEGEKTSLSERGGGINIVFGPKYTVDPGGDPALGRTSFRQQILIPESTADVLFPVKKRTNNQIKLLPLEGKTISLN